MFLHAFIEQILVFNLCISFTRNFNVWEISPFCCYFFHFARKVTNSYFNIIYRAELIHNLKCIICYHSGFVGPWSSRGISLYLCMALWHCSLCCWRHDIEHVLTTALFWMEIGAQNLSSTKLSVCISSRVSRTVLRTKKKKEVFFLFFPSTFSCFQLGTWSVHGHTMQEMQRWPNLCKDIQDKRCKHHIEIEQYQKVVVENILQHGRTKRSDKMWGYRRWDP